MSRDVLRDRRPRSLEGALQVTQGDAENAREHGRGEARFPVARGDLVKSPSPQARAQILLIEVRVLGLEEKRDREVLDAPPGCAHGGRARRPGGVGQGERECPKWGAERSRPLEPKTRSAHTDPALAQQSLRHEDVENPGVLTALHIEHRPVGDERDVAGPELDGISVPRGHRDGPLKNEGEVNGAGAGERQITNPHLGHSDNGDRRGTENRPFDIEVNRPAHLERLGNPGERGVREPHPALDLFKGTTDLGDGKSSPALRVGARGGG